MSNLARDRLGEDLGGHSVPKEAVSKGWWKGLRVDVVFRKIHTL